MRFTSTVSPFIGALVIASGLGACQSSSSDYTTKYKPKRGQKPVVSQRVETSPPSVTTADSSPNSPVLITYSPIVEEVPAVIEVSATSLYEREALESPEAPSDTDWAEQGADFFEANNFEQAIVAFRNALVQSPDSPSVWGSLGQAYMQSGERERGIECLEEALSITPSNGNFQASLIRGQLKEKNVDQALSQAQTLATLEPEKFRSHFLLGRSYSVNRMWKEAIGSFQKALEIKPDHTFANNNLGYVALQIGENELAVEALEKATDQSDAPVFMYNSLGLAYERINKPVSAMTAFHRALEGNPKFVKAIVNRDRLTASLTPEQQEEFVAWRDGTLFDDESPIEPDPSIVADATQVDVDAASEESEASQESTTDADMVGDSAPSAN